MWEQLSLSVQEIICFLGQGWIQTIVGMVGGAALGGFLYWRSRVPGILAFQSRNVSLIGDTRAIVPAKITILCHGTPVSGLTSSTIWIWNAGKKTVRGTDIVALDPLCLYFSGEVLNVKIGKVSREAIQITATASEERRNMVHFAFEFLDPGDGGVLEVLHSGSAKIPHWGGTVIGLPKGIRAWGPMYSRKRRKFYWFNSPVMFIAGVMLLSDVYLAKAAPLPSWLALPVALIVILFSLFSIWFVERRPPSSLRGS